MDKVYLIMMKYWIEDFYEEDTLIEQIAFSTYEKAKEFLLDMVKNNEDGDSFVEAVYEGVDYVVVYGEYNYFKGNVETLWNSTGAGWYYIEEVLVK